MYLIKWEGFTRDQCTWEPRKNIEKLGDFLKKFELEWRDKVKDDKSLKSPESIKKQKKKAKIIKNEDKKETKIENSKEIDKNTKTPKSRLSTITPIKSCDKKSELNSENQKPNFIIPSVINVPPKKRIKKIKNWLWQMWFL